MDVGYLKLSYKGNKQKPQSHRSKLIHSNQQALGSGIKIDTEPTVLTDLRPLQNMGGGQRGPVRYSGTERHGDGKCGVRGEQSEVDRTAG